MNTEKFDFDRFKIEAITRDITTLGDLSLDFGHLLDMGYPTKVQLIKRAKCEQWEVNFHQYLRNSLFRTKIFRYTEIIPHLP